MPLRSVSAGLELVMQVGQLKAPVLELNAIGPAPESAAHALALVK